MASETQQHHPLPWTVDNAHITSAYDVFDANGRLVANCGSWSDSHNPNQHAEKKANARYIVQACNSFEDLLAALKRAVAAVDQHNDGGSLDYDWVGEAEDAIAKATSPQA